MIKQFLSAVIVLGLSQVCRGQADTVRIDTGRIDTAHLSAAVVRADKRLFRQQPYGTVVNVESSIMTRGSSILEVLERSPGILIDHRNNSIALNGKNGVMVMIDGRLLRMSMDQVVALLSGMSADNIERIELLTTPPSQYDAEGSGGLINIVLKKNKKQGTNGTVSATAGYGWREKGTASVNLSHNTPNSSFYGSYTFSHDRSYDNLQITSTQDMPFLGGQLEVGLHDTTHVTRNNHDATAGFDLHLNPRTTLGGSISYSSSHAADYNYNHQWYNVLPDSLLTSNGFVRGDNRWKNLIGSLYMERALRAGEKISFGIDYLYYHNNNPSSIQSSFLNADGTAAGGNDSIYAPIQRTYANTGIHVGVAGMDYKKDLSPGTKLEAGLKETYTHDSSSSAIQGLVNGGWVIRAETSANIVMKESISAAYASLTTPISPSVNLVAGARYEYSRTTMNDPVTGKQVVNRKLGELFPSLFLSWKVDESSDWQLSYTKRISRPSYNDLASFVGYSDPSAIYAGNPFLLPTITHNLKLGYNEHGYSFSLLFSRDENPIARYQLTESPRGDLLEVSPQNLRYQNSITAQAGLPWRISSWWTMNYALTGSFIASRLDYTLHPLTYNYLKYSLNLSETFLLPKSFSIELSGWYSSFSYNGTIRVGGYGSLNAGIKKELPHDAGVLQLSAADLFRTEQFNVQYGTLTQEAFSIQNHVRLNTESSLRPILKLTYSRSFGGGAVKSRVERAGDEKDRVRKD